MTVNELCDRESIRDTLARYNVAGDSRNREAFMALFAADAVFEFDGFPPVEGFRLVGRAAIDPAARWQRWTALEKSTGRLSFLRHHLTTCQIDLTGADTAAARTYFVVFTDIGPDHMGVYDDVLKKQGERWVFTHRKIRLDWRSADSLFPVVAAK